MACSRNLVLILCVALLGVGTVVAEQKPKKEDKGSSSPKKKDKDKEKTDAKSDKKAEPATGEATPKPALKLSIPLPEGQDSRDIVIPQTDELGKKSMSFHIGVGRRIDSNNVKMTDLLIETFDATGVREMTVELPGAMLDIPKRIISGKERATIKRSDFEITGQELEFNTETRKGTLKGDVRMIIFDLSDETDTSKPKESKEPKTGAAKTDAAKEAPKPAEKAL